MSVGERITRGIRTGIYIDREILNRADEAMGKTNARSRSEFISEALEFYIAWLHSGEISKVLTPALEDSISKRLWNWEIRMPFTALGSCI